MFRPAFEGPTDEAQCLKFDILDALLNLSSSTPSLTAVCSLIETTTMDRPTSWRTADFRFPEFDTGKLAFELSDYQHDDGPSRAPTLRMEPLPTSRSNTWKAKAGELPLSGSIWVGLILSFVPYSLYIVKSLMDDDPPANWILLSASNANLLISVLSQLFVFSLSIVIGSTLDALRWQLASSDRGISLETFFGLSRATQLLPALRIMRSWRPSLLLLCHFRHVSYQNPGLCAS